MGFYLDVAGAAIQKHTGITHDEMFDATYTVFELD